MRWRTLAATATALGSDVADDSRAISCDTSSRAVKLNLISSASSGIRAVQLSAGEYPSEQRCSHPRVASAPLTQRCRALNDENRRTHEKSGENSQEAAFCRGKTVQREEPSAADRAAGRNRCRGVRTRRRSDKALRAP